MNLNNYEGTLLKKNKNRSTNVNVQKKFIP